MLPDYLSAEGEQRCRRLLAEVTVRLRARPAAAAVLVPLCSVRGVPALLYTLRSSRLAGRHKGDVSFPGGKCDPTDRDVVHTALRETHEELGLVVPEEHVWGVLQPVYDQVSLPGPEAPTSPYPLHHLCLPWARSRDPQGQGSGHGLLPYGGAPDTCLAAVFHPHTTQWDGAGGILSPFLRGH
uniref:Nudix hydrolase 8 n=1 Tax=Sus scrofa TaxID=9823 RepID=A0A4X1T0K2_PIG